MKITVLGSGGGEAFPSVFCNCEHCAQARAAGGKSIRTLSQTLINDDLLIDFPADTAEHARRHGICLGDIPNMLITHTHFDHFAPTLLCTRGHWYAHDMKCEQLNIYGSSDVPKIYDAVTGAYGDMPECIAQNIVIHQINAYESSAVGKYTVTALPAKHAKDLIPLNYVISDGQKTLLYLHDTGYPSDDVIDFIVDAGIRADCVMMDATMGVANISDTAGHMSFAQNKRLAARLRECGIATQNTVFVANHITHNQAQTHEKIEQIFEGTDILVSYDGMVIDV